MPKRNPALDALRHHVSGAVERGEATPITAISPVDAAIEYLRSRGEDIEPVTKVRYRTWGFRYYSRTAQQMLTDAQVIEYADNMRAQA
jgi:hypothetical protein